MERPVLGYLTPKRENMGGAVLSRGFHTPSAFLQTPKRDTPTYILTSDPDLSSPGLGLTTLYAESTPLYTPPTSLGDAYWSHFQASPDTPLRRQQAPPERTLLVERMPHPSSYTITPERQPQDFLSPDRSRHGSGTQDSGKRGRPRADIITNLIMEGAQSNNAIKCHICSRDFPREKSLQAHLRTHTGERPYNCDYPGCAKTFTQSGQLKTHQRLHAGDKPFVCSADGCTNRYTHANRTCPDHPYAKPKRSAELLLQPVIAASEDQGRVAVWLEKYRREREEKTPGKGLDDHLEMPLQMPEREVEDQGKPKLKTKRGLADELEQAYGQENIPSPPRPQIHRSDLLRSKLTGALQRTAEKMERSSFRVLHLGGQQLDQPGSTPGFRNILELPYTQVSPAKSRRHSLEEASPLRGIRRTLGEITPSKNCQTDQAELELPFSFDLAAHCVAGERLAALPSTPRAREPSGSPGNLQGSPALKLKKRFQERFQEEKAMERGTEDLAQPIAWAEEEEGLGPFHDSVLTTPVRRRELTNSPTYLVAGALLELHESPVRAVRNQDVPLNLTTKSPHE